MMRPILLALVIPAALAAQGNPATPPAPASPTTPAAQTPAPAAAAPATVQAAVQVAGREWREIGKTSTGNPVFVDPASIVRRDSTITGTFRVVYLTPVKTPKGNITGARSTAMFLCKDKKVAVKESVLWIDEAAGTIYQRTAPRMPGFGPVWNTNFSGVALEYLCSARR